MKTMYFLHSCQLHSVLFIHGTAHGHRSSQSHSLLSLLGSVPGWPCASHQVIPGGAAGLSCSTLLEQKEQVLSLHSPSWLQWEHVLRDFTSMFLAHFLLWVSFRFFWWGRRIKENFAFLMTRLSILTIRKAWNFLAVLWLLLLKVQISGVFSLHFSCEDSSTAKVGAFAVLFLLPGSLFIVEGFHMQPDMIFLCVKK